MKETVKKRFASEIGIYVAEVTITSKDEEFVKRAIQIIFEHLSDPEFSVSVLIEKMNVSRSLLYMKLKEIVGKSASDFIQSIRIKEVARLLKTDQLTVAEVAYKTGFSDPSYFSKCFRKHFEISPKEYSKSFNGQPESALPGS
ncbi:MAG: AraC family transcriptional regulator [Cytophagales bacterium]|nr:AraC family transcriptional regulator [Cytophagales bacterium]